jgi:hypothetical protein
VRLGRGHVRRVVPLEDVGPGLRDALLGQPLLPEAGLDRPRPLPPGTLAGAVRAVEGGRREVRVGRPERDAGLVRRAPDQNHVRSGDYTCEGCGYRPARDPRVPPGEDAARFMLDVHHVVPLASGERESTAEDLVVLCPLRHRRRHAVDRVGRAAGQS